jgi:hypothetical protein
MNRIAQLQTRHCLHNGLGHGVICIDGHLNFAYVAIQVRLIVHGRQVRGLEKSVPLGDFGLLIELFLALAGPVPIFIVLSVLLARSSLHSSISSPRAFW